MIYVKKITTPANTPKSNPLVTQFKLTAGFVYKVEIRIPPGHKGYTGIAVFSGGHPLWPSNMGEWFSGDNERISFDESFYLSADPNILHIHTYNESDGLEHSVYMRIGLVSKREYIARYLPSVAYLIYREQMAEVYGTEDKEDIPSLEDALSELPFV